MGNKLTSKNLDTAHRSKDEQIMADIHDFVKIRANPSGTTSSSSSNSISRSASPQIRFKDSNSVRKTMTEREINQEISNRMLIEQMQHKDTLRLLLVGDEGSGKTAIFKHIQDAFRDQSDADEQARALPSIHQRILRDFTRLCQHNNALNMSLADPVDANQDEKAAKDDFGSIYKLKSMETQAICDGFASASTSLTVIPPELAVDIYAVWKTLAMQHTFDDAKRLNLVDEASQYFLDKVLEISSAQYTVTPDDMFRVRESAENSGIAHTEFVLKCKSGNDRCNVAEIVVQKSEARRWTPWLDNVNAIVYVVNMAMCHQDPEEDGTNPLQHTMQSFRELCSQRTFDRTNFVVLFNECEVFEEDMELRDDINPQDGNDAAAAKQHVMAEFIQIFHETCSPGLKRGGLYFHDANEQVVQILAQIQTDVATATMKRMGYVY